MLQCKGSTWHTLCIMSTQRVRWLPVRMAVFVWLVNLPTEVVWKSVEQITGVRCAAQIALAYMMQMLLVQCWAINDLVICDCMIPIKMIAAFIMIQEASLTQQIRQEKSPLYLLTLAAISLPVALPSVAIHQDSGWKWPIVVQLSLDWSVSVSCDYKDRKF